MHDARGDVLYVGKARALQNRVTNYTQVARLPKRLQRMVSQTRSMTIVTTNSEAEALLLEAQLIKRYRPPYNVLLRDDKSFPFILLREDHAFPARPAPSRRAARKGNITGRSPAPDRSTRRSTRCRSCSCCEAAPTASSRIATGRACSTRSAAARRRASAGSTRRLCRAGRDAKRFLGGKSTKVQQKLRRDERSVRERWISSWPPSTATVCAR
jgi:excinuclease ABC subunit C